MASNQHPRRRLLVSLAIFMVSCSAGTVITNSNKGTHRGGIPKYDEHDNYIALTSIPGPLKHSIEHKYAPTNSIASQILRIRGGVIKATSSSVKRPAQKSRTPASSAALEQLKEAVMSLQPATRYYLYLVSACTLLHVSGLPVAELFALDRSRPLDLWRPFTSVAFFGVPSMAMANSIYFLVRYGQELERSLGFTPYAWFLLLQTAALSLMGWLLQFPYQSKALVASIVYNSCLIDPNEKIPFQFGLVLDKWQMAYGMMAIDCLSAQSMSAAWPHIMGILSGHAYHYYTNIRPAGRLASVFRPPRWFSRLLCRLGVGLSDIGDGSSNIPGLTTRKPPKPSYRQSIFGRTAVLPQPKGRRLTASPSGSEGTRRGKSRGK